MICHQAEGVNPVAEARHAFRHEFIEAIPVLWREEDVLVGVAAQDDVIEAAGDVKAGFAGHVNSIDWRGQLCN